MGTVVYFDPYLSNSVQELEDSSIIRKIPIPYPPSSVVDANWVLISHDHIDHCDPHTLPDLAKASPRARFVGPAPVVSKLKEWGIAAERIYLASESWFDMMPDLRLRAIPSAHPEIKRDTEGNLACVGYLIEFSGQRLYLAGDTFARQEIIDTLKGEAPIHIAFLPVNEHNFFRGRCGIIGNMSVREAFHFAQEIGVNEVIAVHWDMFDNNSVDPDEIRLIHKRMAPSFHLQLNPSFVNLGDVNVSIIIRTLNEAQYLGALLESIAHQNTNQLRPEVVLVDSGSTDGTLDIAVSYGCRIYHIEREEFSFGRSLNIGCEAARGEILVIISGHCVPIDENWLVRLCQPLFDGRAEYTYGRQLSGLHNHYSEGRIFAKYFPEQSKIPQNDFYCNNANSALLKNVWQKYRFDEELTGLEDMDLAQRIQCDGGRVGYIAEAVVYHHHAEAWPQVRRRFEREAIALQKIMPQVHVSAYDTLRYILSSIWRDWRSARKSNIKADLKKIILYRSNQFIGVLKGNRQHRKLSHAEKEKYFFPE